MPNGATHLKISTTIAVPLAASMLFIVPDENPFAKAAFLSGLLWGTFVTPDLDVDGGNITLKKIRDINKPAAVIWRIVTWPYAKVFNHRGSSHIAFWGTFVRMLYFASIPLALLWYFYNYSVSDYSSEDFRLLFLFFIAASILDIAHIIADIISTSWKKFLTRRRKKRSPTAKMQQKRAGFSL